MRQPLLRAALVLVLALASCGVVANLVAAFSVGPDGTVTMEHRAAAPGIVALHDPVLRSGGVPITVKATSDPPGAVWAGEIFQKDLPDFEAKAPVESLVGVSRWTWSVEKRGQGPGQAPPVGEGRNWRNSETSASLSLTHTPSGTVQQALVLRPVDGTGTAIKPADRALTVTMSWTNPSRFWSPLGMAAVCLVAALAALVFLLRFRAAAARTDSTGSVFAAAGTRRGTRRSREPVGARTSSVREAESTGGHDVIDATTAPVRTRRHAAPSGPLASVTPEPRRPWGALADDATSESLPQAESVPHAQTSEPDHRTTPVSGSFRRTPAASGSVAGESAAEPAASETSGPVDAMGPRPTPPGRSGPRPRIHERVRHRGAQTGEETQSLRVSIPSSRPLPTTPAPEANPSSRSAWDDPTHQRPTNPFASLRSETSWGSTGPQRTVDDRPSSENASAHNARIDDAGATAPVKVAVPVTPAAPTVASSVVTPVTSGGNPHGASSGPRSPFAELQAEQDRAKGRTHADDSSVNQ